jgi:hypothetical protein
MSEPAASSAMRGVDPLTLARAILATTPGLLAGLVEAANEAVLVQRPAPDEWSPQEVITHLRHIEGVLQERLAAMARAAEPIALAPAPPMPDPQPVGPTMAAWREARRATLDWLAGLDPDALSRVGIHRRYGPISVREHLVEWAYHDLDHTRQLLTALEAALYPGIGAWRGLYPPPFDGGS